ncbi:hypothetical protein [Deinococcus sp. AJ005]|uniref:hypothetical protein n=1 Tax=Deinococcus sp. AJ005 TaxID=2652443 RepID=UPI00125CC875|nr:hypothetical protein [Deinococcus sp. AJ005]QFP75440.1 hypothetical protein DAAJ005_02385 [Deinococcus sp. AJ005]
MNTKVTLKIFFAVMMSFALFYGSGIGYSYLSARDARTKIGNDILVLNYQIGDVNYTAKFIQAQAFCARQAIDDKTYLIVDGVMIYISQLGNVEITEARVSSSIRCSHGEGRTINTE